MNNDLISREALKEAFENLASDDYNEPIWYQKTVFETIDKAPTVEVNSIIDGLNNEIDDLSENLAWYVNERNRLLKERRPQGEWVRKEDVIHSIAKQYSEHNELVPIWLSIGDIKGGAE